MSFDGNRWVLAGLTSYGYECALAGYPGIYTNVAPFIDFIQNAISSNASSGNNALNQSSKTSAIDHKNLIYTLLIFCLINIIN